MSDFKKQVHQSSYGYDDLMRDYTFFNDPELERAVEIMQAQIDDVDTTKAIAKLGTSEPYDEPYETIERAAEELEALRKLWKVVQERLKPGKHASPENAEDYFQEYEDALHDDLEFLQI